MVLVIPDFYERAYIRDITNLLLVTMGFKQICVQQACDIIYRRPL